MSYARVTPGVVTLCLGMCLCRLALAQPDSAHATLGVVREDTGAVSPELAAAVDAALIDALGAHAGAGQPTLLPAPLLDVQLTAGCDGVGAACVAAMAHAAGVDALVVRRLQVDGRGVIALKLTLGEARRADRMAEAQGEIDRGGTGTVAQHVATIVRALFAPPEPEPAPTAEPESEPAPTAEPEPAPSGVPAPAPAPPESIEPHPPPARMDAIAPTDHDSSGTGTVTRVVLASGAAVLAGGVVVGVIAAGEFDDVKHTPVETRADAARVRDDYDRAQSLGTAANVLMAVGGAALATGVLLWTLDPGDGESGRDPGTAELRLAPRGGGALLLLRGHLGGG